MVDIKNIDKAALLAALFNASKQQGMGNLFPHVQSMSKDEAE